MSDKDKKKKAAQKLRRKPMRDKEIVISLTAKGRKLMNLIKEIMEGESEYEKIDVNSRRMFTFLKGENMRFIEDYFYEEKTNANKSTGN